MRCNFRMFSTVPNAFKLRALVECGVGVALECEGECAAPIANETIANETIANECWVFNLWEEERRNGGSITFREVKPLRQAIALPRNGEGGRNGYYWQSNPLSGERRGGEHCLGQVIF